MERVIRIRPESFDCDWRSDLAALEVSVPENLPTWRYTPVNHDPMPFSVDVDNHAMKAVMRTIDLIDDQDMLFIQAVRCGDEWHVELAFDMSDFDWEYPLILGHDMPLDTALKLLRQLCVDGASPDDIDLIQNEFRDMGFRGAKV